MSDPGPFRWGVWARMALRLGELTGRAAFVLGLRRRVALDNLARAFGQLDPGQRRRLARAAYAQLGRSAVELLLLRGLPAPSVAQLVKLEGFEPLAAGIGAGRGAVVAVAHFGNWELLARACAQRGIPLSAITRRLRGRLNQRLLRVRQEGGLRELPDKGSTAAAVAVLEQGGVLAVVVDQNMLPRRGIFVRFFGEQASTTPAAAVFALRARVPLYAAFPFRQPDGTHRVRIEGPFEPRPELAPHQRVVALTQALTDAVERAVRERPDHWFWLHRRWKTRPQPEPSPPGLPPREPGSV